MKNNGEQKMTKRYRLYPLKFLMAAVLFFICFNAYAQETMQFESEAKKLEFIGQTLKKEKYLRSDEYNAPHCKQIMKDFLADKNFKAIEPVVRADSIDDPRMAKWRQCEEKELLGGPFVFRSLDSLGAPPYRWYRIELDANIQNGPEDMIYHNQTSEPGQQGETGYTWVDLSNCKIKKGGFTVTGALARRHSHPNATFLNALVYYKGELWAADFIGGFSFKLMRWIDRERMETCDWWLYKPKETVK
jgi:hypothetical protein